MLLDPNIGPVLPSSYQPFYSAYPLVYWLTNTLPEGSWDEVMRVIGQAHSVVHSKGVVRVQSSMRVGTRYVATNLLSPSTYSQNTHRAIHTLLLHLPNRYS